MARTAFIEKTRRQSGLDGERGLNLHITNRLACASSAAFASLPVLPGHGSYATASPRLGRTGWPEGVGLQASCEVYSLSVKSSVQVTALHQGGSRCYGSPINEGELRVEGSKATGERE